MYRNEWEATAARVAALETQLRAATSSQQQDAATIAMLTQQLQAAQADLARLRGAYPQPPPYGGYAPYGYNPSAWIFAPRGTTILVLGILSLVVCGLMGPVAWSMGNTELQRIDAGQVDPSTRGNVQAGRICGMVASILLIVSVAAVIFLFAVAGTASTY